MKLATLAMDGLAFLLCAAAGVLLILGGVGILSFDSLTSFLSTTAGAILQLVVGALFLLISARFVEHGIRAQRDAALFSRDGEWGRISLTPQAIREFIGGVLTQEIGLTQFTVHLRHKDDGLAVTVRTALSPDQQVSVVGREIQESLSRHVEDRTGVAVRDVAVLVRSIRSGESASDAETSFEEPLDE